MCEQIEQISQPNEIELRWREFRKEIRTEIPTINFSWDEMVCKHNRGNSRFLPSSSATQDNANA